MKKSEKIFVLVILLCAFCARLATSLVLNQPAIRLTNNEFLHYFHCDPLQYTALGVQFAQIEEIELPDIYPTERSPGYPFLLSVWFRIFGVNASVFILTALIGTIVILELFIISRLLFPDKPFCWWLTIGLAALWPNFIISLHQPASDSLYLAFILSAIIISLRIFNKNLPLSVQWSVVRFIFITLLFICAIYVRPQGIIWFAGTGLGWAFLAKWPGRFLQRAAFYFIVSVSLLAIFLGPWLYRNYRLTGRFIFLSENAVLFQHNNETFLDWSFFDKKFYGHSWPGVTNPNVRKDVDSYMNDLSQTAASSNYRNLLFQSYNAIAKRFIREHPFAYLKLMTIRLIKLFMPTPLGVSNAHASILTTAWLTVFPAGFIALWRYKFDTEIFYFLTIPFVLEVAVAMLIGTQLRHRLPIDCIFLVLAPTVIASWMNRLTNVKAS